MTPQDQQSVRILQLTDSHLGQSSDETLVGINTEQSFRDVLAAVVANHGTDSFDLIAATGDISNDGTQASYQRFVNILREYLPDTPLAWVEGNHDDPAGMLIDHGQPMTREVTIGRWKLILLSSRVPFEERGELPQSEIERLELTLLNHSAGRGDDEFPVFVVLHHQPVPIGCAWLDQYRVANAADFFDVLDRFSCVKGVAWGHVHQEFYLERGAIELFATPSTCVQFKPLSDDFAIDTTMPGYRIFNLHHDGRVDSEVKRVEGFSYNFDLDSTGY